MQSNDTTIPKIAQVSEIDWRGLAEFLVPEGNPYIKDLPFMKWSHIVIACVALPIIVDQIRLFRRKLDRADLRLLSSTTTAASVTFYLYIFYEMADYYFREGYEKCHVLDVSADGRRLAYIMYMFHVGRFFIDVCELIKYTLANSDSAELPYEVQLAVSHLVFWWNVIFFHPGGEVVVPVCVVCLRYVGTVYCNACGCGQCQITTWKMMSFFNVARLANDLYVGCPVPMAVLAVMLPFDAHGVVHMTLFRFWGFFPLGAVHFVLYGRSQLASVWSVMAMVACMWTLPDRFTGPIDYYKSSILPEIDCSLPSSVLKLWRGEVDDEDIPASGQPSSAAGTDTACDADHAALYGGVKACTYIDCPEVESRPGEFYCCQRCSSPYCSVVCQAKDWTTTHPLVCRLPKASHKRSPGPVTFENKSTSKRCCASH